MILQSIETPYPLWDTIKAYMVDDNGHLVEEGDFVGVFDGNILAGAFLIKPWSDYCYEIHGGVGRDYWGRGVEVCITLGQGLFRSTPCLKIVAIIPEFNRLMRRCVQEAGLRQEGIITKSFLKWMKLHDQYIYGSTKREAIDKKLM